MFFSLIIRKDFNVLILFFWCFFSWGQTPPSLTATGNQAYCPLSDIPIVESFDISNPDNVEIGTIYIQISEGYINGPDRLSLSVVHPNITALPFNNSEGKLQLNWTGAGPPIDIEFIAAVKDVVFNSSSPIVSGEKHFSITLSEKNYLPSTDHYYEYVADLGITWKNAKIAAEGRNYYGRQGYLATITSMEEAVLSGEQAAGAGWIGGSDEAVEGTWRWVTGPEAGKSFWFGDGNGTTVGTDIPFAFWNSSNNEPNNLGDEDFAHVTAPGIGINGSWNDLSNTGGTSGDYQPKGYIVEYGMPGDPPLNISASTEIFVEEITATKPAEKCGPGTLILEAESSSGFVLWFDAETGGAVVGSGNSFTTPLLNSSSSFYAAASPDGFCDSGKRTEVYATIKTIPEISSVTNNTICGAGSGLLEAEATTGTINWYENAMGGTPIHSGNSYVPTASTTTTYYVDAVENGCTTVSRTPVVLNVQYTNAPIANSPQEFCDIDNATLEDLTISGTNILWYSDASGGTPLNTSFLLVNNTIYYASQTLNGCESTARIAVQALVYETVVPIPWDVPNIDECDNASDGDDTNGFTIFDLTVNNTILLNGKDANDFNFSYFTSASYSPISKIPNPTSFQNTIVNEQDIYVRIENKLDYRCYTDLQFKIFVNALPIINSPVTLKNCDEDGVPDGYTDFNLTTANPYIINGDTSLNVTYYLTYNDASNNVNPVTPSPFNNFDAINNQVFGRVENTFGCYRIATVELVTTVTNFPPGFKQKLAQCDADATIDGISTFDLTTAADAMLNELPSGQNLSIHFFRNLTDAQLQENEILPQNSYENEIPFLETLYVRVNSEDNGDCYGIGQDLSLIVYPRPEFEVNPTEIVCLNLDPIILETFNAQGDYSYQWFDESGNLLSNQPTVEVAVGGTYAVLGTSIFGCESFLQEIIISESEIASIGYDDVIIRDDSSNNIIEINNMNNNLGLGDYEFSLDDSNGPYQDAPIFEQVSAGLHTIYVRDKNNCGVAFLNVSVIGYPNFFTPNNDGSNDYWQVDGLNSNFYPVSIIYIFDRFGKLIAQIDPNSEGWDGIYNGEQLPADDYWFTTQLQDSDGNIRERKGHFSLIR